jgi:hypothetical protein
LDLREGLRCMCLDLGINAVRPIHARTFALKGDLLGEMS